MTQTQVKAYQVKILETEWITHDVKRFKVSKSCQYNFVPGQATEIAINLEGWKDKRRPFTFTSLADQTYLEFTIKIYNDHNGVTKKLGSQEFCDELLLHEVFGAIKYKGEGTFIAGGAGVTPFIAILRQLHKEGKIGNNQLIFSNKTAGDIILQEEFSKMLGKNFINTLTEEKNEKYDYGMIDKNYLESKISNLSQFFYICGPEPMIDSVKKDLLSLGVDENKIVIETF